MKPPALTFTDHFSERAMSLSYVNLSHKVQILMMSCSFSDRCGLKYRQVSCLQTIETRAQQKTHRNKVMAAFQHLETTSIT